MICAPTAQTRGFAIAALACIVTPALAHTGESAAGGFAAGFGHPFFGPDHLTAMVAVGMWGALLGAPAIWLLPVVFPLIMAFGGVIGVAGVPLPAVEVGIAASALLLGALVALAAKPPIWLAVLLVGLFGLFHGYAHGREMPAGLDVVGYSVGFVVATGLLHLAGIAIGLFAAWPAGRIAVRLGGAVIALAGAVFLSRAV